jgi:predicted branched-subunit amino acid permease
MYVTWQVWTYIGVQVGASIPDPSSWGLDFALSATFIGLLIPMLRDKAMVAAVFVAGAGALVFHNLPNQFGLILAAILGVATGVLAERLGTGAKTK